MKQLLGIYIRTLGHYLYPPRWKSYIPLVTLSGLGVLLLSLEFAGFRKVFLYMNSLEDFTVFFVRFLLERFVGLIFLISYSMIFMSSIINGLSTLFLSESLPFLYTLPVPRWRVLLVKFLENWIVSCYLIVLFLGCFLVSYVHTFQLSWTQYLICGGLLILFTLSPVALGSAMVTVLIRFFPARRIHQVVTLIAVIFLGALMIAIRMMRPELLLNPQDTDDFVALIKDMTIPSLDHLPSAWASYIVIYGDAQKFLYLLGFTAAAILFMVLIFRSFYDRAFLHSQESRTLRSRPASRRKAAVTKRGQVSALVIKDLKIFTRDATQWSQLFLLGALVIVYLLNIKNLAIQMPMVRWVVSFINLGLAGFVLAALSVRFLFPSVSSEGRSFWMVKTLPLSSRKLLWCKYIIYFPPFLLFTQMLVFFSNRILEVPAFFVQLSMLNILGVAFALTGLAIGIGALMPNFKTDHPSKIAVGPGGVLYMLLSFIYLAVMLMIQIRPVWYYVIHRPEDVRIWIHAVAAITLTLIVALLPMELGARRLARREYL